MLNSGILAVLPYPNHDPVATCSRFAKTLCAACFMRILTETCQFRVKGAKRLCFDYFVHVLSPVRSKGQKVLVRVVKKMFSCNKGNRTDLSFAAVKDTVQNAADTATATQRYCSDCCVYRLRNFLSMILRMRGSLK